MEVTPVDTTGLINQISEQGVLFSFMLLVIIVMSVVIRVLYKNNQELSKEIGNLTKDILKGFYELKDMIKDALIGKN